MTPLDRAPGAAPIAAGEASSPAIRQATGGTSRGGMPLRLEARLAGLEGEDPVVEIPGRRLLFAVRGEGTAALRRAATAGGGRLLLLLPRLEPGDRPMSATLLALDGEDLDLAVTLRRLPATAAPSRAPPRDPTGDATRPQGTPDLRRPFAATLLERGRAPGRLNVVLEPARPPAGAAAPPSTVPSGTVPSADAAPAARPAPPPPPAIPGPPPASKPGAAPPASSGPPSGTAPSPGAPAPLPPGPAIPTEGRPAVTPAEGTPPPASPASAAAASGRATASPAGPAPPPLSTDVSAVAAGREPTPSFPPADTPATSARSPVAGVVGDPAPPTRDPAVGTAGRRAEGGGDPVAPPPRGRELWSRLEPGVRIEATVVGRDAAGRLQLRLSDEPAAPLLQIEERGLDVPVGSRLTVRIDRMLREDASERGTAPVPVPAGTPPTVTLAANRGDAALRLFAYLLRRAPAEGGDRPTASPARAEAPAPPAGTPGSGGAGPSHSVVWFAGGEAPRALRIGEEVEGETAAGEDGGRRWVFALELAALGAVRLELWSRAGSRQLAVRSERPLPEEVRRLIADMFGAALEITGRRGWLLFTGLVSAADARGRGDGRSLLA